MIEKGFIIRNGIRYGAGVEDANSVVFDNTGLDLASTNMQAVTEELNNTKLTKPEEISLEQYNDMIANGTLDDTKNYIVTGTTDPYFMSGSLIGYDNATSGILADNVQNAIDEVHAESIKITEKGQANGVATLNEMGVVPSEQINVTGLNVKGTWDADSNTPALTNGTGENGDFYIVSVAGSADFGAGEISFAVGDWVLYTDNGVWEKSVNASAVHSVNGKTGLVTITADDLLTEAQLGVLNSGISTSDKAQIETNKLAIEGLTTSKQDSLSEDQLKAVDSGIDDVQVAQIETNKNTIATMLTEAEALGQQVAENTTNVGLLQTATTDLRTDVDANTAAVAEKLDKTTDVANAGKPLFVGDDGAIGFSEAKGKIYTSLESLGLVAPVGVGDIFNALPDNSTAQLNGEDRDGEGLNVVISDIPASFGILTIRKANASRFSIDFQNSLGSAPCNVKRWIGTLKGSDGTGITWKELALRDNFPFYTALSQLGLDTTSSLHDITRILPKGGTIAFKVDAMANKAEYNNILLGTVTIHKVEDARVQAIMTSKSDGRTWIGKLDGNNDIAGWNELGHVTFSTLAQLGLDASATIDDVVMALPIGSTALFSVTEFTNYQTMFPYSEGNDRFSGVLFIKGDGDGRVFIRWFRKDGKDEAIGMQNISNNSFAGWRKLYNTLKQNTQYFKIDITKAGPGLNGNLILSYNKDGALEQVLLSTIGVREVRWTRLTRASTVQNVTYTIDANDNTHITIGIELDDIAYGTHQVDVIGSVAVINSFTGEAFTGDAIAALYLSDERVHVSLEELGLTADATPSDVLRVLPVGGQAAIDVGSFTNWQTLFPVDESNDNLATFTAVKGYDVHGSRTVATYVKKDASKIAYGGISANNQIQWWNKVNIKGVGDVATTAVPISSIAGVTTNSESSINYYIKNGVCCVSVKLRMSIQTEKTSWTTVATGLPRPAINISQTIHSERNTSDIAMALRITAGTTDGTLQMIFTGTTTTDDWWTTTFTYPV